MSISAVCNAMNIKSSIILRKTGKICEHNWQNFAGESLKRKNAQVHGHNGLALAISQDCEVEYDQHIQLIA